MADYFNRDVRIVAGPLEISPRDESGATQPMLAVKFDITKTQDRSKNKAKLTIYNLQETNRAKLQEKNLECIIEAGYVDERVQIFKGDIDKTRVGRDRTDWIVELELLDGGAATKSARINESLRGGQQIGQVLKKAAAALGLDAGNLDEKVKANGARSVLKELVNSVVLSGRAEDVVDKIASDMGLKFSIQDKKLQFLAKDEALPDPAVPVSPTTGLLGSPFIGDKGVVTAKVLLNGRIKPGRLVKLESVITSGTFIADKVKHAGATWGDAWTTSLEMLPQS